MLGTRTRRTSFAALLLLSTTLAACGGGSEDSSATGAAGGDGEPLKVAALFSGAVTDADYNALGSLALDDVEGSMEVTTTFSESVAVPDTERVIQEYLADDQDVIWTHGSQFYEATAKLAAQNPDVTFIGEFDAEPADLPDNVWVIDRNFHVAFYPIGVLAGASTKTGKIGYVGGLSLPFSYSEVHAMQQALDDTGSDATITPVWTGDFNDPAKAQQITSQLLSQGNDVIVGSLNLGMVGVFNATKSVEEGGVLVTAKYTDKSQFDPEHYATSAVYDFTKPLNDILTSIADGERSGYYPLGFDTGVQIPEPQHVEDDVKAQVEQAVSDVTSGGVTVAKNLDPIE